MIRPTNIDEAMCAKGGLVSEDVRAATDEEVTHLRRVAAGSSGSWCVEAATLARLLARLDQAEARYYQEIKTLEMRQERWDESETQRMQAERRAEAAEIARDGAREERNRLRAYGRHKIGCDGDAGGDICACGLEAARFD